MSIVAVKPLAVTQGAIYDAVTWQRWIILPDGHHCFKCCHLCDMRHHINDHKINDVHKYDGECNY